MDEASLYARFLIGDPSLIKDILPDDEWDVTVTTHWEGQPRERMVDCHRQSPVGHQTHFLPVVDRKTGYIVEMQHTNAGNGSVRTVPLSLQLRRSAAANKRFQWQPGEPISAINNVGAALRAFYCDDEEVKEETK